MVRFHLDNGNFDALKIMIQTVKISGYTIPQDYLDTLENAKIAVQRSKKVIP